ncbi:hypothetical protein [Pseudohoeflea coraliihabitans]|uniref:Uncharacterized protein n=1 Tax=Pseudohoeflea coraliihabitans TaxID=2860393 RepID=A0ABS6WKN0_9HYPH|nr:hypothetical protein [Pseudohoeflea sp. DP4N28-3]MBW3096497.1 hypothetical protein [Pseudohoeflea sp. DP4N28-3]
MNHRQSGSMDSVTIAFELMRLELGAEVDNLNAYGASLFHESQYEEATKLGERGKALRGFLEKVQLLEAEWVNSFAGTAEVDYQDPAVEAATRQILSNSKSPKTALLVRYPCGEVVAEKKGADTLIEVIKRAGAERVAKLGILVNSENIVSRTPSKKYNEARVPPHFIKTHSSTAQKKRNIEQISDALGLGLTVEIIS